MAAVHEIIDIIEIPVDGHWRFEVVVVQIDGVSLAIIGYGEDSTWFNAVPISANLIRDIPTEERVGTTLGCYPFKISTANARRYEGRTELR